MKLLLLLFVAVCCCLLLFAVAVCCLSFVDFVVGGGYDGVAAVITATAAVDAVGLVAILLLLL